ncbi:MAG: class I SAM-dependent methyltransferase [Chloroflexota bacterium]
MPRDHAHPEPPGPEGTPAWAEWVKDYYRDVETYDWVAATDRFSGPETLFHRRRSAEARRLIARHLGPGDGPILDAGCGTGLITRHLPPGATGIDINPRNIALARERLPEHAFVLGDVEALPFADGSFGGALCTEVIEHIPAPDAALRELARVLRPGGVLIGMTPGTSPVWSLRFLSRSCPHSEPFHRNYTTAAVRGMLEAAGLAPVSVGYTLLRMSVAFVARRPGG